MTVCFIASCSVLGGAERVLLETLDVLKERDVTCRVLVPGPGELADALEKQNTAYSFLDGGSWITWRRPSRWDKTKNSAKIALRAVATAQKCRAWKADLIYSNSLTRCDGALAARILGLPHLWHLHEFGREDHGVFYLFGENFTNKRVGTESSACIIVSKALRLKYERYIEPSKLNVIYPSMHRTPVDMTEEPEDAPGNSDLNSRKFRLMIAGGVVEGKGQLDAVKALGHLVETGIDAQLTIVGSGEAAYRELLEQTAGLSGISEKVFFTGRIENVSSVMRAADVILVCSRSEAFGRVTVEAMRAGRAVVAARSGATPELVEDGVSGLLYKSGDSFDLAAKVRLLYNDPALRRRLGKDGRELATSRFTRQRYGEEVVTLIRALVAQHRLSGDGVGSVAG